MNQRSIEILLVEDNPGDVRLTEEALKEGKVINRLSVVPDGVEALAYLLPEDPARAPADGLPKVVLLDLKLPRVDGLEVLRRLKASERTRGIPVVVLTSSREEIDMVRSYDLGANSYIVKPVDFGQFVKVIKELKLYWMVVNSLPS